MGSKGYFVTARTTTTSLALRSKFVKANIVVAHTRKTSYVSRAGVYLPPFLCKCYFMTKDYSSTASGPPSLTREGLSVSIVLQMIY